LLLAAALAATHGAMAQQGRPLSCRRLVPTTVSLIATVLLLMVNPIEALR
jgi:hypothetical protein